MHDLIENGFDLLTVSWQQCTVAVRYPVYSNICALLYLLTVYTLVFRRGQFVRATRGEDQFQSRAQVGAGTHAVTHGLPRGTGKTGAEVSQHSEHIDILSAGLSGCAVADSFEITPATQRTHHERASVQSPR